MTQSPPKAKPSSRPPTAPSAGGGGRFTTALAAGGSVLVLSTIAVVLWPRTYGTEAMIKVEGAAPSTNPSALAARIEAALLERQELAGVAMDLPPALRAPDPIGRLRAGIRVQSHGGFTYGIEFRGSDQHSVQRIADRLAARAVALLPELAASPEDTAPALALAERTRAVTEFLTAHPEMSLEAAGSKPSGAVDSGLEALRTEKRQIELRLNTAAPDNPYSDPGQTPEALGRRLAELKTTIARREKALREPRPSAAPELVTQWRALLADLAAAQAAANNPSATLPVSARVTARAPLPSSPLTPNRLVLSIVAALLSAAAAMAAYALPRFAQADKRAASRRQPNAGDRRPASEPPPRFDEPAKAFAPALPSEPPQAGRPSSDPPPKGSDPPPRALGSEPPGPIAGQRTVVVSGPKSSSKPPPPGLTRSKTQPGGLEGPAPTALATASAPPPTTAPSGNTGPIAPLFGSRPPPGAGSYSVSSSHPPAMESVRGASRTTVERLSPLQSAHPPAQPAASPRRAASPSTPPAAPQIVSLPPALDPQAETWAARFETPPPPPPEPAAPAALAEPPPAGAAPAPAPPPDDDVASSDAAPKRARWRTQVMGSMVPLEVTAARERQPAPSAPPESVPKHNPHALATTPAASSPVAHEGQPVGRHLPTTSTLIQQDLPFGWRPDVQAPSAEIIPLRDAVLKEASARRITLLVTGSASPVRASFASALGLALSESGATVLLVEADFDSPALHQALSFVAPPGAGFSQQLMAHRQKRQPEPWVVMRCSANLQVLAEGRFRSPGWVGSPEFEDALRELSELYQVVIIHGPALTNVHDLGPLGPFVEGVVVVRSGQPAHAHFGPDPLSTII